MSRQQQQQIILLVSEDSISIGGNTDTFHVFEFVNALEKCGIEVLRTNVLCG